MLMTATTGPTIKSDHLLYLRRFLEQIELDGYYTLIVEKLKVYSIGDLRYVDESDLLTLGMSKPQFRKMKRHLPPSSSSRTMTSNNTTMLTSTLGKLLVRKLTLRSSSSNITRSTLDLNSYYDRQGSSGTLHLSSLNGSTTMGNKYHQQKNIISPQHVQLIEQIGEGEFGTVFKAFWRTKQNELLTVAIKRLHKLDQNFDVDDILKEVCVLQDIEHKHIVEFFGIVIQPDSSFMLVTEYAHCRSLYECLVGLNAKREYSLQILLDFLKQITLAMSYLEKKLLIHRDLASRNFLVFNKSLVKLSDFGLCRLCRPDSDYYKTSWKDTLRLPIAWMSPEAITFLRFTTASDVFSFGVCMWECFTYGQMPWQGLKSAEIVSAIDAPNHQRLPRPAYATVELYEIMLHCWKFEPSDRPTFSQLEKTLGEIDLKLVCWKEKNTNSKSNQSIEDGFLSMESCIIGPLTILDRCLNVPISPSSTNNNNNNNSFIQCVSADGQIGFVYSNDVEPLHVITLSPSTTTTSTMSNFFHKKIDPKKNLIKTKSKQLSKDMIGLPQADFIHAFHIGVSGETFGDVACLGSVEKTTDLIKIPSPSNPAFESNYKQPSVVVTSNEFMTSNGNEQRTNDDEKTSSLLDEVMQAFTEIYSDIEVTPSLSDDFSAPRSPPPKPERSEPTSPKSPTGNDLKLTPISPTVFDSNQSPSDDMAADSNNRSPALSRFLPKLVLKKPNDACRFTRELEQRLQNGDISEQAKNAYNLLVNGCGDGSFSPLLTDDERCGVDLSSTCSEQQQQPDVPILSKQPPLLHHPTAVLFGSSSSSSSTSISTSSASASNPSSSSNRLKSDRNSHYSSTSTDNDVSIDLKQQQQQQINDQTDLSNTPSPLRLLRNGVNPSNLPIRQTLSTNLECSSNISPLSSTSNTLSNLSSTSPLFDLVPLTSQSSNLVDDLRSITGQPLPPPPDLSSLGSKLTTATMTHTLKLPAPTSNTYRAKKRFNLFA